MPYRSCRRTLRGEVSVEGVALHCGARIAMTLAPAPVGCGRIFRRLDLGGAEIPARYDLVGDTRLGTFLTVADASTGADIGIGVIEHLMAALSGCGIDDVVVSLNGPEPPILDGSAWDYVGLIERAGMKTLDVPLEVIEILRPVRVEKGDASAELSPVDADGEVRFDFYLDYAEPAIGRQHFALALTEERFKWEIAPARTFGFVRELDTLHAMGLARGASLDNTLAFDANGLCNPGGLRFPDECVRHKILDAIGDLALAGAPIRGRFSGVKSGHTLNQALLQAVFSDPANFRRINVS